MAEQAENYREPKSTKAQYDHVITLIETGKKDSLTQYGDMKKDLGHLNGQITEHHNRISALEEDKIRRDAIDQYKRDHPEVAQKVFDTGQKEYNKGNSTVTINKELLTALKYLGLVIAALATALIGMKFTL